MKRILIVALPLLLGCSTNQQPEVSSTNIPQAISANLYLSRGSIWKAPEFEQLAIKSDKLLSECGITKGDRTLVAQQNMITIPEDRLRELKSLAGNFSESIKNYGLKFEPAAKKERFFDGGKLLISLSIDGTATTVETTVDSIAEPSSPQEKALAKLVSGIRGEAPTLCGNPTFFGITKG